MKDELRLLFLSFATKFVIYSAVFTFGMIYGHTLINRQYNKMFTPWYEKYTEGPLNFERGDKVELVTPPRYASFYAHCDATFIASQATEYSNQAMVLLKNCAFQTGETSSQLSGSRMSENPTVDLIPLSDLRKK